MLPIGELAKLKKQLNVKVSIFTKPDNAMMNSVILGIISSALGSTIQATNSAVVINNLSITYENFCNVFIKIILPSISDRGSIVSNLSTCNLSIQFGNCNNIIRVLSDSTKLPNINNINLGLYATIDLVGFDKHDAGVILYELQSILGVK